jgi:predicted nucleotide-binding protein
MNWLSFHQDSETLAASAHEALLRGDATRAKQLFGQAADAEERALEILNVDKPRTLGITAVSAVALWYKAGELDRAEQLAHRAAAMNAMPPFAKDELRELLQTIWSEQTQTAAGSSERASDRRRVLIVQSHDGAPREAIASFLRNIEFVPIIPDYRPNRGRTIIEQFEHAAVDFAVVILTPEDVGGSKSGAQQPSTRQNVILELGYFIGKLGRKKVSAIKFGDLEMPSDIAGVAWTAFDNNGAWKADLVRELSDAGHSIDFNKVMGS